MSLLAKDPWTPPQTDLSAPTGRLTKPHLPGSAEQKPAADPSAAEALARRQGDLLTAEQEWAMAEHLPIVRFIARRIHERLPRHVSVEDLQSAGVLGLLDAFDKFDSSKDIKFRSYAQFRLRGDDDGDGGRLSSDPRTRPFA
jgi:RNA polymerase sigma factor FliA